MSARGRGRGHGGRMGTRRNPQPEVSEGSDHEEKQQQHGEQEEGAQVGDVILQLVNVLQGLLDRLGLQQEVNQQEGSRHSSHQDREVEQEQVRERSHSPQRRVNAVPDQDVVATGHMRTHPPFDGLGSGIEAQTWLLDLGRCFVVHSCSSNTKARCAIMHLCDFATTWWHTEEKKLHLDTATVSWDLYLERFRARFLSEHWR